MFLGFDASTQSFSAIILCPKLGKVVAEDSVHFGSELPHYDSPSGFLKSDNPHQVHANPLMWIEALDLLLGKLKSSGAPLDQVRAISGAGQQHATVYLKENFPETLRSLNPEIPLVGQIKPTLSRITSPIWMDASTQSQCEEISNSVGSDQRVCNISGSIATPRFSGPQIRKFYQSEPEAYCDTSHIHLASSFLASILAGQLAPIDPGDGSGMNLLDLEKQQWNEQLLTATAPELNSKLPNIETTGSEVGPIANYFVERYNFSPQCMSLSWTGDNPASLVGMGASQSGHMVISLGTSDTLFAAMQTPVTDPMGYGHVFGNPLGGFMSLTCFANGSLVREKIKDQLKISWDEFAALTITDSDRDASQVCLPFMVPEITPKTDSSEILTNGWDFASASPTEQITTLLEGQFFNMWHHMQWMKLLPETIYVTGGASQNPAILQLIANIFQCSTMRLQVSSSVALGAAIIAAKNNGHSIEALSEQFCDNFSTPSTPTVAADHYAPRLQQFIDLPEASI